MGIIRNEIVLEDKSSVVLDNIIKKYNFLINRLRTVNRLTNTFASLSASNNRVDRAINFPKQQQPYTLDYKFKSNKFTDQELSLTDKQLLLAREKEKRFSHELKVLQEGQKTSREELKSSQKIQTLELKRQDSELKSLKFKQKAETEQLRQQSITLKNDKLRNQSQTEYLRQQGVILRNDKSRNQLEISRNKLEISRNKLAISELRKQKLFEKDSKPKQITKGKPLFSGVRGSIYDLAFLSYGYNVIENIFSTLAKTLDLYPTLNAQTKLLNNSFKTQYEWQQKIFESAERSRAKYDETFKTVSKLGILAGNYFKSPERLVKFIETLNKSFKVVGSSNEEISSGLYQITQAIASGRLQGDEFRTVMEAVPTVLKALSSYMKVPIGSLKTLAKEGKITSDVLINSVLNYSEVIDSQFATIPTRVEDVMTSIKNQITKGLSDIALKFNDLINTAEFGKFIRDVISAILMLINVFGAFFGFIVANWSVISELIKLFLMFIGVATSVRLVVILLTFRISMLNLKIFAIAGIIYIAIYAFNNWGTAGKILAGILLVLAIALQIATAFTLAFNVALWSNPYVLIAAAIALVVIVIILFVVWIKKVMQGHSNMKYDIIRTWNAILHYTEGTIAGMKIAFILLEIAVRRIFTDIGIAIQFGLNIGVIAINSLIDASNQLLGTKWNKLKPVEFTTKMLSDNKKATDKLKKDIQNTALDVYLKDLERRKGLTETYKQDLEKFKKTGEEPTPPTTVSVDGGNLDTVKSIKNNVGIDAKDLEMLSEFATRKFINKYTTLQPNIIVNIDNVNETADMDKIMEYFNKTIRKSYETHLEI